MTDLRIRVDAEHSVSALWTAPPAARAAYVFAHGAGAGMTHWFMGDMAGALAQRGVATLRFQFPAMEAGLKRPDRPPLAHATVRAAVARARALAPDLPLFAGGKSFGGRMTSQAQAAEPLSGVRGLIFLGFPLHPAGKPASDRAAHLADVAIPMLFVQGDRDALADMALLAPVVAALGTRATLRVLAGADHSFAGPAKLGLSRAGAVATIADAAADWIASRIA